MAIFIRDPIISPSKKQVTHLTPVKLEGTNLVTTSNKPVGRNERILVDTLNEAAVVLDLGYRYVTTREAYEKEKKRMNYVF